MPRKHEDDRYYMCSEPNCTGTMIQIGVEPLGRKQAVYECSKCKRRKGESALLMAYNQVKRRD